MRYHTGWRQFFFLTIATVGRRAVLSRLAAPGERPILLPAGEAVHRALRAMHGQWPSVTLSNYCIMPDHVHFLLIIDPSREATGEAAAFGGAPTPLFVAHRMMDAAEHLHGSAIFERTCYMELSFSAEQLHAIRRYIRLNPDRALWKAANPDMFKCRRRVSTALLRRVGGTWDALGDITLLASPFLFHVRLTMKKTAEEHREAIDEIIEKARRGMIPVSGFISAGEREALRRLKEQEGARFIKVLPYALPHRYDPSAEDSRELAAHRMLIISNVPLAQDSRIGARRGPCLAMNDQIAALCAAATAPASRAAPRHAMCAFAALAALCAAFTPLADADWLEPSIQNEVDHALAIAPTNAPPVAANTAAFATNGLTRSEIAIRLVSLQKADGRWYSGTNDVTAAAIAILKAL